MGRKDWKAGYGFLAVSAAVATAAGAVPRSIAAVLSSFGGVEHRLEPVLQHSGATFYNDSIATTPESVMVALEAFTEPIILIAGGSSKNLSFAEVGRRIARRAKAVVLLGATAGEIEKAILDAGPQPPPVQRAGSLEEAVRAAVELAKEWRTDRALRRLEAWLIAADREQIMVVSGEGDVVEPDEDVVGIGSGGGYAAAAAKALLRHSELPAQDIARISMEIAADMCIYTNSNISIVSL